MLVHHTNGQIVITAGLLNTLQATNGFESPLQRYRFDSKYRRIRRFRIVFHQIQWLRKWFRFVAFGWPENKSARFVDVLQNSTVLELLNRKIIVLN